MATVHQVSCVKKSDRQNPHERIRSIGGRNGNSTDWELSEQEAIQAIEDGKWNFFVARGGRQVNVIIAFRLGHKYLKTEADGEQPDNLLSLPECR